MRGQLYPYPFVVSQIHKPVIGVTAVEASDSFLIAIYEGLTFRERDCHAPRSGYGLSYHLGLSAFGSTNRVASIRRPGTTDLSSKKVRSTYAEELLAEGWAKSEAKGRTESQVEVVEGLLRVGVTWNVIEASTAQLRGPRWYSTATPKPSTLAKPVLRTADAQ